LKGSNSFANASAQRLTVCDNQKVFLSPRNRCVLFDSLSLAYDNRGRPMDDAQIDQELRAALYLLGFNFLGGDLFSGEIAEIKGDMTIKLVHPRGEELKFVVELPDDKQMTFRVDRSQIVTLSEWQ
jgi:hypothetical protein